MRALGLVVALLSFAPPSARAESGQGMPPAASEPARLPILASPTTPPATPREPTMAELEEAMPPTLTLPEFRLRAGGGVAIATGGDTLVWAHAAEEFDWQPAALEFVEFGVGAAETIGPSVLVQAGLRVGAYAWFCEDAIVRCQGALDLRAGVRTGAGGTGFDLGANLDLRLLFDEAFELTLRGAFATVELVSFLDVTLHAGAAF